MAFELRAEEYAVACQAAAEEHAQAAVVLCPAIVLWQANMRLPTQSIRVSTGSLAVPSLQYLHAECSATMFAAW